MIHHIAVIIACDARPLQPPYKQVGPMSAQRIESALAWRVNNSALEKISWICGAGVKESDAPGPTLSVLNLARIRQSQMAASDEILCNNNHVTRDVWGTAEEIRWVVWRAREAFPHDQLRFVFFTGTAHMLRVKLILRVLFPEVSAEFVETSEPLNLCQLAEVLKCGKVLWLWLLQRIGLW